LTVFVHTTFAVKLLNNALATYNLAATARMLNLAAAHGVPAKDLFEVIGVSTGQNWMSDNFIDVQYDLLRKDVGLLRDEIGSLPAADLNDEVEQAILRRVRCWALIPQTSELEGDGRTVPAGSQLITPSTTCTCRPTPAVPM
jgi:hypothetical protein